MGTMATNNETCCAEEMRQFFSMVTAQFDKMNRKVDDLAMRFDRDWRREFDSINTKIEMLHQRTTVISKQLEVLLAPCTANSTSSIELLSERPHEPQPVDQKNIRGLMQNLSALLTNTAEPGPSSPEQQTESVAHTPHWTTESFEGFAEISRPTAAASASSDERPTSPRTLGQALQDLEEERAQAATAHENTLPTEADFQKILIEIPKKVKANYEQVYVYEIFFALYVKVFGSSDEGLQYLPSSSSRQNPIFDGKMEDLNADSTQYKVKHIVNLIRTMPEYNEIESNRPTLIQRNLRTNTTNRLKKLPPPPFKQQSTELRTDYLNTTQGHQETPSNANLFEPIKRNISETRDDETGAEIYDPDQDDSDDVIFIFTKFADPRRPETVQAMAAMKERWLRIKKEPVDGGYERAVVIPKSRTIAAAATAATDRSTRASDQENRSLASTPPAFDPSTSHEPPRKIRSEHLFLSGRNVKNEPVDEEEEQIDVTGLAPDEQENRALAATTPVCDPPRATQESHRKKPADQLLLTGRNVKDEPVDTAYEQRINATDVISSAASTPVLNVTTTTSDIATPTTSNQSLLTAAAPHASGPIGGENYYSRTSFHSPNFHGNSMQTFAGRRVLLPQSVHPGPSTMNYVVSGYPYPQQPIRSMPNHSRFALHPYALANGGTQFHHMPAQRSNSDMGPPTAKYPRFN